MVARTLLAFDFDWSLIEENSDTFVIRELGADAIYQAGKEQKLPWTRLMDLVLAEAAAQLGRTPADVTAALCRTPLHPALADVLRRAAAAGDSSSSSSSAAVDTVILSDANSVYIGTILEHHGLRQLVLEVHTNPAEWRGGALRVAPLHGAHPHPPHGCPHCPANLCKGKVMSELLLQQRAAGRQYSRILYVGDGRGDYCPSALLLHGSSSSGGGGGSGPAAPDAAAARGSDGGGSAPLGSSSNRVFAREQYPDGLPCSLWVMLRNEAGGGGGGGGGGEGIPGEEAADAGAAAAAAAVPGGAPRVVPWTSPEQLAALLVQELQLG